MKLTQNCGAACALQNGPMIRLAKEQNRLTVHASALSLEDRFQPSFTVGEMGQHYSSVRCHKVHLCAHGIRKKFACIKLTIQSA